jgi:hypothetical protein
MHDESARQKGNRARTLGANKETLAPTGSGKILGRVDSRETSAPTECRDAESTEAGSVRESGEVGDDGAVKTVPWATEDRSGDRRADYCVTQLARILREAGK